MYYYHYNAHSAIYDREKTFKKAINTLRAQRRKLKLTIKSHKILDEKLKSQIIQLKKQWEKELEIYNSIIEKQKQLKKDNAARIKAAKQAEVPTEKVYTDIQLRAMARMPVPKDAPPIRNTGNGHITTSVNRKDCFVVYSD